MRIVTPEQLYVSCDKQVRHPLKWMVEPLDVRTVESTL